MTPNPERNKPANELPQGFDRQVLHYLFSPLEGDKLKNLFGSLATLRGFETIEEYECEIGFIPKTDLTEQELMRLSGGNFLDIEQAYVNHEVTREGGTRTIELVRLRKTSDGQGHETRRIAYKHKSAGPGKEERQILFQGDEESTNVPNQTFTTWWERARTEEKQSPTDPVSSVWGAIKKRRFYIPQTLTLPDGNTAQVEIHYDIHEEPPTLRGYHRIEVELNSFNGKKNQKSLNTLHRALSAKKSPFRDLLQSQCSFIGAIERRTSAGSKELTKSGRPPDWRDLYEAMKTRFPDVAPQILKEATDAFWRTLRAGSGTR